MTRNEFSEAKLLTIAPVFYSADEVAAILGVTVITIYSHIKDGSLKASKVCGRWKISKEDLERFIEGGK